MALIHRATLVPSKLDAIAAWIPSQPWWDGSGADELDAAAAYRFDDPDGEVGIETHLLRTASGTVFQVPLTYRSAPLDGADAYLVATMDHSVLGPRWVYDGVGDPVYVAVTATAIAEGAHQAELVVQSEDGSRSVRESTTQVWGTGGPAPTAPRLSVRRVIDAAPTELPHLIGTWPGQAEPVVLVELRG
ncbi:CG0192-related protein [Rhodococcus sp. 077-4]|uniref:CG0192-related protein n=1 Tax=Rhodococcus sp. 077-4 TaxID=2789271 RepID=UPI0039F4FD75